MKFSSLINLLGVCDRYNEIVIGMTSSGNPIFKKNLIGLRQFQVVSILPFPSKELYFVLALNGEELDTTERQITIVDPDGTEVGKINFQAYIENEGAEILEKFKIVAAQLDGVISKQGIYRLIMHKADENELVGSFVISYIPALPLTPERVQAIKSDPLSAKYIHYEIGCKKCGEICKITCGVEKKNNEEGYIWYKDLPDEYKCKCGELKINLIYIKESLHALLGHKTGKPFSEGQIIERSYTADALEKIVYEFEELIKKDKVGEEEIQKYIENNPIVLSVFSPELLKFKAPVTSKYKTDFVALNSKNELILIEIEKPSTQLFKKDGTQHSELTHAIGQVQNWLLQAKRNRLALIDDLGMSGVKIDSVTDIKGVVIAGKNKTEYTPHLEKLRSREIEVMTYDELLRSLCAQIRAFKEV